jgi:hypothetical protein
MNSDIGADITLRIYRALSGKWVGRLFLGDKEIGSVAICDSPEAVEQVARDTGLYPDHIEVY